MLVKEILNVLEILPSEVWNKERKNSPLLIAEDIIKAIIEENTIKEAAISLNISRTTIQRILKRNLKYLHPEELKGGKRRRNVLLEQINKKYCTQGNHIQPLSEYYNCDTKHNGKIIMSSCKTCEISNSRYKSALYRARKLRRTPLWQDLGEINKYYIECPVGYEVDHIIPLRGETVSGLHVLTNLQYLTRRDNRTKSNTY